MGQAFLDTLRGYITDYGYWAVGISLLLENAGIPLPGETILRDQVRAKMGRVVTIGRAAVLTKGPVGFVIPALALGLYLGATGSLRRLRDLRPAAGGFVFAAVACHGTRPSSGGGPIS